jgi:hypothetical protein
LNAATLISSANIGASVITTGTLNAATLISSANIGASVITTGTLNASTINSSTLVSSANIGASAITVGTLIASTSLLGIGNSNTLGSIITTGGNVGVGVTPSYKLHVSGDIYATGDISAFSDMRLKSNIRSITDSLDRVSRLRGVYYTHTETQKESVGLIAQETLEVLPEVVATKGEYLGINYGNIVGLLIEAIKEIQNKVDSIQAKVDNL